TVHFERAEQRRPAVPAVAAEAPSLELDANAPVGFAAVHQVKTIELVYNLDRKRTAVQVVFRDALVSPLALPVFARRHLQADLFARFLHRDVALVGGGRRNRAVRLFVLHLGKEGPKEEQTFVDHGGDEVIALDFELDLLPRGPLAIVIAAVIIDVRLGAHRA